jgi:anti-sigma factor ChrR (cupin superfamily)
MSGMADEFEDDGAVAVALAPQGPVDVSAYTWHEILPGIHAHLVVDDKAQQLRKVLIRAQPGAVYPKHRHLGPEEILVLQGRLRDAHGEYGPGDILRSAADSVHTEEALPGEECICFVVYRGEHEFVE